MKEKQTIILADDHPMIISGLRQNLIDSGEFVILGEVHDYIELRNILSETIPDMIIIDIQMPGNDQGRALDFLLDTYESKTKFIIYTSLGEDVGHFIRYKKKGIKGYLQKMNSGKETLKDIISISKGGIRFDNHIMTLYFNAQHEIERKRKVQQVTFSNREIEVIRIICLGLPKEEREDKIINEMGISPHTFKTHRKNVYRKAGVSNVAQLYEYALEKGFISK